MKMNVACKRFAGIISLIAIAFGGCVKNSVTQPPPANQTVAQVIKSATNLTLYNTALARTGLDTLLSNPDSSATVFVVPDQIMVLNGLTATIIDTMNVNTLRTIMLYNIYLGSLNFTSLIESSQTVTNKSLQVASGDSIFYTISGTAVYVDGISVPTLDVSAGTNGYLEVLMQPMYPPAGSILQITQADTNFAYFDSAVSRTTASSVPGNNIQALLSSGIIYTVLVPNNNAFRNATYVNPDTFSTISPDTLAKLLLYHIIPNRYFTSDMNIAINAQAAATSNDTITVQTLSGNFLKITSGATYLQAMGNSDSTAANLYFPNVMARNGVVHKIDQILHQ
jgi:uncharacterized surface protein with fasciclin (FAS1) repeats